MNDCTNAAKGLRVVIVEWEDLHVDVQQKCKSHTNGSVFLLVSNEIGMPLIFEEVKTRAELNRVLEEFPEAKIKTERLPG